MKDDYLWDRSGEPDPDTERLERTLSRLRHRPKPLELPVVSRPRRPGLFHAMAAAAAIVLTLLAAGLWLSLRRAGETPARQLSTARATSGLASPRGIDESVAQMAQVDAASRPRRVIDERHAELALARRARRERREERMMREGELATEKLMLALHYASSKLNLVQRRIQVNKENGPAS